MQRPRPESKESAARTRSFTSTPRVDVIVLTTDTALLAALREAAGAGNEIFHAESAESAVDLLVGGHCGIFVIDVQIVRRTVADLIDKLQSQFPEVVLLATGRREEQNAVATLVGSGRIYRFLHKPVSPARAELFLSTATRRYSELHPRESRSLLRGVTNAAPRTRKVAGGALLAVLATAGAIWLLPQAPTQAPSLEFAVKGAPTRDEQITTLLREAVAAADAGNIVSPPNENALQLYRSVLELEADNEQATAAIAQIIGSLEKGTNAALAARDLRRSRTALATLQRAAPDHPRLHALQSSLAALSRNAASAPASPASTPTLAAPSSTPAPVPPAPTTSATPNLDLAKAYLAANQLIVPLDASALGQLRRARDTAENESTIQIIATDLGTRLLNRALSAVESGNGMEAKASYDAALNVDREFETTLPDLELVAERIGQLERTSTQASTNGLLERAIRLRMSGQLLEPAEENAFETLKAAIAEDSSSAGVKTEQQRLSFALLENTRTALAAGDIDRADVLALRAEEIYPGAPQARALREQIGKARAQREEATMVLQATSLPRRREVPAIYPREALINGAQGWVDLEFTISEEGVPLDITVKAAEPRRTFDVAATQALRQWRFEPIIRDGSPRARRAALRMEFKLED